MPMGLVLTSLLSKSLKSAAKRCDGKKRTPPKLLKAVQSSALSTTS